MNSITTPEAQAIASAFTRGTDQLPRALRVTTQDVCNTLRFWQSPTHDEWVTFIANVASKVQTANALSAAATAVVVDMLGKDVQQDWGSKPRRAADLMASIWMPAAGIKPSLSYTSLLV